MAYVRHVCILAAQGQTVVSVALLTTPGGVEMKHCSMFPLIGCGSPLTPVQAYRWPEGQLLCMGLLARCFWRLPGNIYYGLIHQ